MATTGTDMRSSGSEPPDSFLEDSVRTRVEAVEALPMERVNPPRAFFRGAVTDVADIFRYRELLSQLVRKELKVKYKDSVLGFFWTLVRPMAQLVIYYLAFTIFLGNQQPAYAIFIFSGLVVWGLFTDILGGCTGSIVGNGGLLKKTYFPREIFPLSVVGAALVNFALQMLVLFGALAVTAVFTDNRVVLTSDLGLVPLALLVCLVWGLACGLFLAAATVYFRDLQHLIEIVLLALFWLVPIVYPVVLPIKNFTEGGHTALLEVYLANPMLNVVVAFQRAFYTMGPEYTFSGNLWGRLAVLALIGLGVLWLAQRYFARAQGDFAQEL
jgi:ABC-2 type transport system permease protein